MTLVGTLVGRPVDWAEATLLRALTALTADWSFGLAAMRVDAALATDLRAGETAPAVLERLAGFAGGGLVGGVGLRSRLLTTGFAGAGALALAEESFVTDLTEPTADANPARAAR